MNCVLPEKKDAKWQFNTLYILVLSRIGRGTTPLQIPGIFGSLEFGDSFFFLVAAKVSQRYKQPSTPPVQYEIAAAAL